MSRSADDRSARPYVDSLGATVAAALVAGLVVALTDVVLAARSAPEAGGAAEVSLLAVGLYALPSLAVGVFAGLVGGAWRATFGDRALRRTFERLRDEPELDARIAAGLIAAGVVAACFALFAAAAAGRLVAGVERQGVGALLMGAVVTGALPLFAAAALLVYRLVRPLGRLVPRPGPVPGSLILLLAAAALGAAVVSWVMFTRLDWRALRLGGFVLAGLYLATAAVWVVLWRGPLAGLGRRVSARGSLVAAAAAAALLLPPVLLRGAPSPDAQRLLSEHTSGARALVGAGRGLLDGDGDGYSAFLGGPDCDDTDPDVHPGAEEIFDNGIDDNCVGGDRTRPAPTDDEAAAAGESAFTFEGNVLILTVDTLRADRLGAAGYRRDDRSLTPRLDAFADDSIWFTRAWAHAPNTPRSFPSLFASRYPSQVAVDRHFKNYSNIADENTLIWEVLRDAGLHTIGHSSHFYFTEERGIRQGFVEYDNEGARDIAGSNKDIASPRIVPRVEAELAELAGSGERFAMFVHLFEPHSTYVKHEEFPITEGGTPGLIQKYDYEIAYVDRWIGRVLDALDEHHLAEDTMVVVLSDHGEAFGVHRVAGKQMFFHGQTLYDELLRVPLLIRVPGLEPRRVDQPVGLVDVAPTIVDTLGLEAPDPWVGRSLLPAMVGDELSPRPVYAELLPAPSWEHAAKMMVTADGRHKIVYRISDRRWELYDLQSDPTEEDDLAGSRDELRERLADALIEWMEVDLPQ